MDNPFRGSFVGKGNQFFQEGLGFFEILAPKSFRVALDLGFKSGRYEPVSLSSFQVLTMLFLRRSRSKTHRNPPRFENERLSLHLLLVLSISEAEQKFGVYILACPRTSLKNCYSGASTGRSVVTIANMPLASRAKTERVIIQISPPPASK